MAIFQILLSSAFVHFKICYKSAPVPLAQGVMILPGEALSESAFWCSWLQLYNIYWRNPHLKAKFWPHELECKSVSWVEAVPYCVLTFGYNQSLGCWKLILSGLVLLVLTEQD